MVTSRPRAKSVKKAYDREKAIWDAIRVIDRRKETNKETKDTLHQIEPHKKNVKLLK